MGRVMGSHFVSATSPGPGPSALAYNPAVGLGSQLGDRPFAASG